MLCLLLLELCTFLSRSTARRVGGWVGVGGWVDGWMHGGIKNASM